MFSTIKSVISGAIVSTLIVASANSMANDNGLPDLGTSALTALSIEKEKRLGEVIYEQFRGNANILHDPLVKEYINDLGNRLVAHADDVKFPFTFFVVNEPSINAFAFYGGHIGIQSGLIDAAETESQLASVLAHEIAHVTQRHIARRKQAANENAPLTLAGFIGAILLAAVSPQAVMASLMATSAGSQQAMINHTRSNEMEADRIGMNILVNSGYDPAASAEFFEKLQEQIRYKTKLPPFLVTHPLPDSRVSDARLRAMQYERKFYSDNIDFLLIKARVRARFVTNYSKEDLKSEIKDLNNRIAKASAIRKFALQYELLLRLVDSKQFDKATDLYSQMVEKAPNNMFLLDTYTDLMTASKQYDKAISKLKKAYELKPNNSIVTLNLANTYLEAESYQQAIELLEYYLIGKPNDFLATQMLMEAYNKVKNMAKYNSTKAELYALMARYGEAIGLADKAMSFLGKNDNTEISRLQALKRQYRERLNYIQDLKDQF